MSILDDIIEVKRMELTALRKKYKRSSFGDFAPFHSPVRPFAEALSEAYGTAAPAIIAEIKRASPSAGLISTLTDLPEIARQYENNGATAVSVLTDKHFFQGCGEDLTMVRSAVKLPILRKDFIIGEYQVLESRALGADAILLIAATLEKSALVDLHSLALELGMDVLVEVHESAELEKIDYHTVRLVGINNRNLASLTVDLDSTPRIAKLLPHGVAFVSESGLHTAGDVRFVHRSGATAVLMGEVFMKTAHPGNALKDILDELRQN